METFKYKPGDKLLLDGFIITVVEERAYGGDIELWGTKEEGRRPIFRLCSSTKSPTGYGKRCISLVNKKNHLPGWW